MAVLLASSVPVFAVSYTTDGFFTTVDVQENASMHVTEEIYVTFTSDAHGIYRYIPSDDVYAYFMHDGTLQSKELAYKIQKSAYGIYYYLRYLGYNDMVAEIWRTRSKTSRAKARRTPRKESPAT